MFSEIRNTSSIVTIDKIRNKRIHIELRDENNELIEIQEIAEKLAGYVQDRMNSTEANTLITQITPLMGQTMSTALQTMIGRAGAMMLISIEPMRYALINLMSISFYLYKFLQKHKIKIHTLEEDITQEEIDEFAKKDQINSLSTAGSVMGLSPQQILKGLIEGGFASKEDLIEMGIEEDQLAQFEDTPEEDKN